MTKRGTVRRWCAVGLAVCAGAAWADIPGREPGQPIVSVTYQDGQITMRDLDGTPLIMPRGMPIWEPLSTGGLTPTIVFVEQPAGFDLVYQFRNNYSTPKPLGAININTITLGPTANAPDFRFSGQEREVEIANPPAWTHNYPGLLYSPVAVLHNDRHAIGVSLQYPILEYEHDCSYALRTRGGRFAQGEGGQGWQVKWNLSSVQSGQLGLYDGAVLDPGESAEYVVSVRVTRNVQEWIRTLVPYRNYFQSMYGVGPQYPRQRDPVLINVTATVNNITLENPYGFDFRRADRNGFRAQVEYLLGMEDYRRYMVWAPTGVYRSNFNYPFQFTSRWAENPVLISSALDIRYGWPRLYIEGRELGLWWGNSGKFASCWNPSELPSFDPENPEHVEAALHELDMAIQAGARSIGLDSFSHKTIRLWDAYPWIQRLRARYPGVKFVMEPKAMDIMHTICAGYFRGYELPDGNGPVDPKDVHALDSPHYLADFLVPGHETWAVLRWEMYPQFFGRPATIEEMQRDVYDAAEKGYVPFVGSLFDIDRPRAIASESWLYTVPADLRQEAANESSTGGPNTRYGQTNTGSARQRLDLSRVLNRTPAQRNVTGRTQIVNSMSAEPTRIVGAGTSSVGN